LNQMKQMKQILVIDDDFETCEFLTDIFSEEGWEVTARQTAEDASAAVAQSHFDLIVSDINLGGRTNGVALLKEFKQVSPGSEVVLISGFGSLETAVAAVREGAFDYVSKPFDVNEVIGTARRALKREDLAEPAAVLKSGHPEAAGLIGHSPKMIEIYKQIALVAPSDSTVLVTGESGTGKELVARAIHLNSPRSAGPFVTVNCGALTETLLEAELFGHTKGSFTGAVSDKRGLFEEASGGTIFLDEIGETSSALQVKLLRALQEGEVRRVGGTKAIRVDARVLAATNRDLEREVQAGRFREDLYYRLNVVSLLVPPLRERREDIPLLAAHLLKHPRRSGVNPTSISEEVLKLFEEYEWPGNVRELENTLEHAAIYACGSKIVPEVLPPRILSHHQATERERRVRSTFDDLPTLDELQRRYLVFVLESVSGSRIKAAEIMGVDRRTVTRMLDRYSLKPTDTEETD
jgi:DNA-binding NtrC family response regulator